MVQLKKTSNSKYPINEQLPMCGQGLKVKIRMAKAYHYDEKAGTKKVLALILQVQLRALLCGIPRLMSVFSNEWKWLIFLRKV